MQLRTLSLVTLSALFAFTATARAQNDDCATPQPVVGVGTFPFDTTTATTSTQQLHPFCPSIGHDVWFVWTAPSTGNATLATCGQAGFDTNIAVYPASGCTAASTNWCDDDACGVESLVTWPVLTGNTYMLEIGGSGGSIANTGPGTFTLSIAGPPANDDCNSPIALGSGGGSGYDNSTATTGTQGITACGSVNNDLWYTWTATMTGTGTLDTCFQTTDDTAVAIYLGSSCPTGNAIACDDNGCGIQSMATFPIVAGATYMLQIGSGSGNGGPGSFIITEQGGSTSIGTPYCFGDGTGTACPCGNNGAVGHGCANSLNASGAQFAATGVAMVSADALVLQGSGMPAHSSVLYFQGTAQTSGGTGAVFGDGLRCASGTVVRLATRMNDGTGNSGYGGPLGDTPVSVRGQVPPGGGTRDYQAWYRNAAVFCTPSTFNLTNGLEIVWAP